MNPSPTVHGNCIVLGEAGVLIRGPSGSGKSWLSALAIESGAARGLFARLVADDRVRLEAAGGRLLAFTPTDIAGLIERRGVGVVRVPYIERAVVRLVVDLEVSPERLPDPSAHSVAIEGVTMPRIIAACGDPGAVSLMFFGIRTYLSDDM